MSKMKTLQSGKLEIIQKGDQLWTTSLDVAEKFGKKHKNVLQAIENLECPEEFGRLNFQPSSYKNEQNKNQPMYFISRGGFSFLVMGFTGKKAAEWKVKYIEAFDRMERTILRLAYQAKRQGYKEWLEARAEGRIIRREETDVIQKFVEYATQQGSKNAKKYYINITQMENKALFYFEQALSKPNNFRELLDRMQLIRISVADNLVNRALQEGMDKAMYYKNIYTMVKERIEAYAKVIGKTPILLPENNNQPSIIPILVHNK